MDDTRKDIFKKIHERCFQLGSCNYKETGCSDCPINVTLVKAETLLDKQEQGLLIELPCKILDTLYINDFRCDYHMNFDRPYAVKVWTIVINGRNDFIDVMLEDGTMYQFYLSDIGKTIFLTKAEAEEALAKMGGKE